MDSRTPKQAMPPILSFFLTRRLPCAVLMTAMLLAMWLPATVPGLPQAIAMLVMTVGMVLHMMTPALVALITFGGGFAFALHVVAIGAVAVTLMSGLSLVTGTIVFLLYGLLPIFAAMAIMQERGIRRSAQYIAAGSGIAVLAGLFLAATVQDMGLREWVNLLLEPVFMDLPQTVPTEQLQAMQAFRESMVSMMPALLALGLWAAWWGNVALARHWAKRYDFYRGCELSILTLGFSKVLAYLFVALMIMALVVTGDLLYLVNNSAIMVGGLLAFQGIMVAHSWLKAKGLTFSIGLMYFMLLIWSVMIIPFVIVGLMDMWFDYRRKIPAVGG